MKALSKVSVKSSWDSHFRNLSRVLHKHGGTGRPEGGRC